jgi:hypothetical protein
LSTFPEQEYKEGYRDGMLAALIVARTCADDIEPATAGDVVVMLEHLTQSSVIQPDPK